MKNYEFKVLRGKDAEVQKTLNQWKHEFILKINSFQAINGGIVVLLIPDPCTPDPKPIV